MSENKNKEPAQPAASGKQEHLIQAPTVNLPKGGGAIRGMGEKFAANPVTGTGSMSIPIATSPGRSGFGPQLSLSYDSGAGNGPFGFGWSSSIPAITRKTDKGLPRYNDAEESDVFILSGAEDLVPEYERDDTSNLLLKDGKPVIYDKKRTINNVNYTVRRYRPRIEGLFARIERWTDQKTGDIHWRSISKDNILTIYGKDANSRISDPVDQYRIFTWLISETRDDRGNAVLYDYKHEDAAGIDLSSAPEQNRGDRKDPHRQTNRYLKRIRYGNRNPLLEDAGQRPWNLTNKQVQNANWMFEVVFDYGEHALNAPKPRDDDELDQNGDHKWTYRNDPFSSYRAGFEVRTYRLCQRVLMFHHFEGEEGVGRDCLIRSTDFTYSYEENPKDARNPIYSFLLSVTQFGYMRDNGGYLKRSLPPVEFEYIQPIVQDTVHDVDSESSENLPIGVDGATYQWTDLHGEGIPGILTEQAGTWFYKQNISPISKRPVEFTPLKLVCSKPNLVLAGGQAQFMDLAGDGQPDLVVLDGRMAGRYEHDADESWQAFRPFTSRLNRDIRDPNLKFVDLDGDGHADVFITEGDVFVWHASLAEAGFGPARRVTQVLDEEKGPRLVFADDTQSIYLADLSGDGLTDLVRIRNGEVCYWPNLGYGRFGAKVTMDYAPHFDNPDQFDQKRIRLADIDGSGTTDIIYLHRDGVRLYFNQSGNSWSVAQPLCVSPGVDDLVSIIPTDLLGNGTACLVWSSPLPGDARRQMRYVDLMGGQKPHLLVKTINNLGAETRVEYAPSTKFYLQDKQDGNPWITRLPFPVHVVERVETIDHISHNRFVTCYKYHHGYFDGAEREFRGFGMVEQKDTEEFAALTGDGTLPKATNLDAASHIPPVLTKTWFHTGIYLGRDHVSDFFAGLIDTQDKGEYYREPGLTDTQARALLLPDTLLPAGLTFEEEREACLALKGSMLRQEVYALDDTPKAEHPYTVTEQNFTIEVLQPCGENRHGVFFSHPREVITYHYERNSADPRVQHALTLEVDGFGNVLKSAAIGYGRRIDSLDPALLPEDHEKQRLIHITCTESTFTQPIVDKADVYRTPLSAKTCTYEFRKSQQEQSGTQQNQRYDFDALLGHVKQAGDGHHDVDYEDILFGKAKQSAANNPDERQKYFRRLIECVRTLYRPDDMGEAQNDPNTLLPIGEVETLALPGESYKLAFTPGLLQQVYVRDGQTLLPANVADILQGGSNHGGYVNLDGDGHWWISSGRVFLSPESSDTATQEHDYARSHFFLPHRYRDPFHTDAVSTESFVTYDAYDLLLVETRDALRNRVTVGERLPDNTIDPALPGNDYRVLQPWRVMDPNRNRTQVAFDALGMVVATAIMGKAGDNQGDLLEGFDADPLLTALQAFIADPHPQAATLLGKATTRIVYDLDRYQRAGQPPFAATVVRETHFHDSGGDQTKIQISFSYSDGFGREIQKKIQAEEGKAPQRHLPMSLPTGDIRPGDLMRDAQGKLVQANTPRRWVGSGRAVFNNKGKPIKQYEPFFSATHLYEPEQEMTDTGVTPVLFYDPVERVIAILHPNHTYEKVVFDPWQQTTYDVNDTIASHNDQTGDPRTDPDIGGYVEEYFKAQPTDLAHPWQTWYQQRTGGAMGAHESEAAQKAAAHADTPTTAHFDTLGRPFMTIARNRVVCTNHPLDGSEEQFATRVELDIEGNQRAVRDANKKAHDGHGNEIMDPLGRIVMRYTYDMLGNRIHQHSMEAGARWMLNDVSGKPICAWDSRGHNFVTAYDALRRPVEQTVRGTTAESDPRTLKDDPLLIDKIEYGESQPNPEALNLRTRICMHKDSAGITTNTGTNPTNNQTEAYDFKGNLLRSTRQLISVYAEIPDWLLNPKLDDETFTGSTRYDAMNRPIQSIAPRSSLARAKLNIIQPVFNEANLLERVDVWLDHHAEPNSSLDPDIDVPSPVGIGNIDYDAKGQRQRIDYKNGASTLYDYDPLTFRLVHLLTRRDVVAFPQDCTKPPPADWPGCQVQNLSYTYDPAGNITRIQDDAQQTVYFRNKRVEPSNDYTYDAIYRLIQASGREHLGQTNGAPNPPTSPDAFNAFHTRLDHPGNGNAMGTYIERYVYDAVGNFLAVQHRGTDPAHAGWTRAYDYLEVSLIEDGSGGAPLRTSNRLTRTTLNPNGANLPQVEPYEHDAHGNMVRMPHLGDGQPDHPNMYWDYKDQLCRTDLGGGGMAYYIYDAAGQRMRKIWEKAPGLTEERIYLGGIEIFRRHGGAIGAETTKLERETLHIMDDKQRIALVETRTLDKAGNDPAPQQLIRYQFGNHLGSASLELDDQAQIISYEEYTPYGSSSYQAVRSRTETTKRYRYTGKERDEESGLYYHGARYYSAWIGSWTSCDPVDLEGGINLYAYGTHSPIVMVDPSGTAPKKYEDQRGRDTDAKAREMKKNLDKSIKEGKTPDPMQKRADDLAKTRGKTPIEQHHHKGIKQSAEVKLDPEKMGDQMSSVWSTKSDPTVQAGIGDKPLWDPEFEGKKRTQHNIAKELDLNEQAKGPKTAKGLEDAAEASKKRLPATADLAERAKLDWTRSTPKGPPVDPQTGKVISKEAKILKASEELGEKALEKSGKGMRVLAKLGKAGRHLVAAVPLVGIVAGQASAASAASQGDYAGAALDEFGNVPVAGDLVDAARGGYALGEAANELLVNEDLTMRHGDVAKAAAQKLGAGETLSDVVGGLAAAGSAVGQVLLKASPIGFHFW